MDNALRITVLVTHGLISVALLGSITHQALAARPAAAVRPGFVAHYRGADPAVFSGIIVGLFITATLLGAMLYPSYRTLVRPVLEASGLRVANGSFEIKEHLAALGLLMLPAYWASWRPGAAPAYGGIRRILTWILATIVWWNFLVGHLLNNIRGLYS